MGLQKRKYKKCHFFDFVLKVMACFNLETFEIFGKHLEHIIKPDKQYSVIETKFWAKNLTNLGRWPKS